MNVRIFLKRLTLFLLACFWIACSSPEKPPMDQLPLPAFSQLSPAQKIAIGQKIWQNEAGGSLEGLTSWSAAQAFPELGIGHFIWHPAGYRGPFAQVWPTFITFAQTQGARPPAFALLAHCPWESRAQFLQDFQGPRLTELRRWLAANLALQADFILERSRAALPKILNAAPTEKRARLEANYRKVAASAQGVYALADYVNFKGEGLEIAERYQDQGWGLLQVLDAMPEVPAGQPAAAAFATSAQRLLELRLSHAPPELNEARWREGWLKRCKSYAQPL